MLVPKNEELIATPYRHEGSTEKAKEFFESGMFHTCENIYQSARADYPVTIMDRESRFCVELYTQYALNEMKFGEADTLARAKNTSVAALDSMGVVYAQKGVVRLLNQEEIASEGGGPCLWLLTQQFARAMETDGIRGCAKIAARQPDRGARARDLAYRLFTIAERKGWTAEAYAYNNLVISWQEIQNAAMQIASEQTERQMEMGL